MKTLLITFSPTGTSRKIGESVLQGLAGENEIIDLTHETAVSKTIPEDVFCVFSVPVYGGHPAPLAMKRLEGIRSDGAMCAVVVTYGNRHYGDALAELGRYARRAGFKVGGGAAFVGEHSYCTEEYPIAKGRPDKNDLSQAKDFGRKLRQKADSQDGSKTETDLESMQGLHTSLLSRWRFIAGVLKIRRAKGDIARCPIVDEAKCNHCGRCVGLCPASAIAPQDECHTDSGKCIRCCACVKGCPQDARTYPSPFAPLLWRNFKHARPNRTVL